MPPESFLTGLKVAGTLLFGILTSVITRAYLRGRHEERLAIFKDQVSDTRQHFREALSEAKDQLIRAMEDAKSQLRDARQDLESTTRKSIEANIQVNGVAERLKEICERMDRSDAARDSFESAKLTTGEFNEP